MGRKPSGEKEWVMPAELAEVLRPMSVAEAESATIASMVKFWRRPLIKYDALSACPCCGGVHRLRSSGICSGCYSANVINNNLTGLALLEHLAKRASGVNQRFGKKKVIKSISPASEPPPPAAHPAEAGAVGLCDICGVKPPTRDSHGVAICGTCDHLRRGVRNQPELVMALLRQAHPDLLSAPGSLAMPDLVVEERDCLQDILVDVGQALAGGEEENLPLVAVRRMAELAEARGTISRQVEMIDQLKAGMAEAIADGQKASEAAVVGRWSCLSEPSGYEALSFVLQEAIDQAAFGKGLERHADGRPFHDQPIMRETLAVGLGFPAGQARKKILEAVRCCAEHPERAAADLLGAINYIAALVIALRLDMEEQAA